MCFSRNCCKKQKETQLQQPGHFVTTAHHESWARELFQKGWYEPRSRIYSSLGTEGNEMTDQPKLVT